MNEISNDSPLGMSPKFSEQARNIPGEKHEGCKDDELHKAAWGRVFG
jgi:hypothetical protein